ncbi:4Fe-4S ferredoxin, iron-sulfur binding domain protein [Alkaliphilus metalliredigens QYMF]|uniref:4Fe-4S ferredoxin, iron-sulfur binding domain protein n=1 Tax=Alkaliphilus metalliredigens (strain QYMF) TaxID=293826 RepID=A6TSX9_ALKMQ|nr:iron-sulfur-binding protein [Alkaliphilus metalliredigens]ABR49297.1 4Fe-4S ferredoxin, iron-sulfur binding domain protein [Alkaliphilus metalliredigens QYMF]
MEQTRKQENTKRLQINAIEQCIGCYSCMLACSTSVYEDFFIGKSALTVKTSGGYQGRVVVNICHGCMIPSCAQACTEGALEFREGGGVHFNEEKCTGCRKCQLNCVAQAIKFDYETKKPIICRQCGICARRCPHQVISMEARI